MSKRTKQPTFRVWIEQVNCTYIDVKSDHPLDAMEKAKRKWRCEWARPRIIVTPRIIDARQMPS